MLFLLELQGRGIFFDFYLYIPRSWIFPPYPNFLSSDLLKVH